MNDSERAAETRRDLAKYRRELTRRRNRACFIASVPDRLANESRIVHLECLVRSLEDFLAILNP